MTTSRLIAIYLLGVLGCGGDKEAEQPKVRSAAVAPSLTPTTPATDAAAVKKFDEKKGDKTDNDWVPAEFKSGAARWKDTGVYLDGKPISFLTWGELPIGLKPVWTKAQVAAPKRPNSNDLGWRWGQQRGYRFTDYLTALGIDIKKVREMHVYGPRFTESIIVTGKDLQTPEAKGFMFRFGANVSGKALPRVPDDFGGGRPPDKISGVMIYVDKEPPKLTTEGFMLDGQPQLGVPYYGDPIRGGVRVYLDNRLATIIKRQELDPKKATQAPDGELQWSFPAFLQANGVDTSKVAEVWVIRNDRRAEHFPGSELETMTFQASAQAKGGVLLTDQLLRANAIALHTKPLTPADLPVVTHDDD